MLFKPFQIKLSLLLSVVLMSIVATNPGKIFAGCDNGAPQKSYSPPGESCTTITPQRCISDDCRYSEGVSVYNCGTDARGYYCYWHDYTCDGPCSGSGGGGGGYCEGGTAEWRCKKITNCKAANRGAHCGWSTSHPVVEKVDCKVCVMPSCDTSAPTNLALTQLSSNSWTLSWTKGVNGTLQYVYVGSVKSGVESNCPEGSGCIVDDENVDKDATSYNITGLADGTVYYAKVVTYKDDECSSESSTLTDLSSCNLAGGSLNIQQGQSVSFITNINSSPEINRVDYSTSTKSPVGPFECPSTLSEPFCNSRKGCKYANGQCIKLWMTEQDAVSLNPLSDNSYVYQTAVTGLRANSGTGEKTTVTSDVFLKGISTPACTNTVNVTVTTPGPWWQVKDSDVQSAGDLISMVPSIPGAFFGLAGPGGFPGVAAYGTSTSLTGANVSNTGWLANSTVVNARAYNYDYFVNQIPSDILTIMKDVNIADVAGSLTSGGTPDTNSYYWYKYDGVSSGQPLTIPATNIGGRKVILLVDNANVNITGNINLTDGQGFFMLLVKGNININPTVGGGGSPNLEGLYFADGTLTDGVGDTQLSTRGSIVANGGISMQRDFVTDNAQPAEFFEFAPDQIMLFPKILGTRRMNWKEVAP